MRIYHNIPALTAYNALNATNKALSKSIEKLSTGLRINSAADDAAGLAISEKMRAQISGMEVATRNAEDGISMLQTAEGALNETHSILQRMRELAVQASNDTLTSEDRSYLQLEVDQLKEQIDRIAKTTQFNKKRLLDGSSSGIWSSTDLATKAYFRGFLRQIDQFGQKSAFEGNFKITIQAEPGRAETNKTDIFKIKHPNVVVNVSLNEQAGAQSVRVDNVPAASYEMKTIAMREVPHQLGGHYEPTGTYGCKQSAHEATLTVTGEADDGTGKATAKISVLLGNDPPGSWDKHDITITGTGISSATPPTKYITRDDILKAIKDKNINGFTVDRATGKLTSTEGEIGIMNDATDGLTANPTLDKVGDAQKTTIPGVVNSLLSGNSELDNNASILFEVTAVNLDAGTVTVKATSNILKPDGTVDRKVADNIVLPHFTDPNAHLQGLAYKLGLVDDESNKDNFYFSVRKPEMFSVGNKFVYNVMAATAETDVVVQIDGRQTDDWPYKWSNPDGEIPPRDRLIDYPTHGGLSGLHFGLDADKVKNKEIHFRNFFLNSENGTVYECDIVLTTNANIQAETKSLGSFDAAYIGKIATKDTKLRDLDKFWNSSGVFMLNEPKTITITQGDGTSASLTVYATDTMGELRKKLNDTIANGLGQKNFTSGDGVNNFVSYVEQGEEQTSGLETVPGTFIIRSLIVGDVGKLTLSGDEDLINAFSLNVVQEAKENSFVANVQDAHTLESIANDVKISGNRLIGVVHPNVDVEFDSMAGLKAKWDEDTRNFILEKTGLYETVLHMVDNSTIFQVGANEGEDLAIDIGDMSAASLGVNRITVTSREVAGRSIGILDTAINRVSAQRAKLGAYQNSLEYTVTNLTTTTTNLTAAESRIRDADMAKEMMELVKLQILNQSGTSMLAQANQLPQSVLSLLG